MATLYYNLVLSFVMVIVYLAGLMGLLINTNDSVINWRTAEISAVTIHCGSEGFCRAVTEMTNLWFEYFLY